MRKTKKVLGSIASIGLAGGMLWCSSVQVNAATLKDVFDEHYYADAYADLKEAFGYDREALWNHFITNGLSEGRNMNALIDVVKYRASYADLETAFGDDWDAYVDHYISMGAREGRDSGTGFKWEEDFGSDWDAFINQYLATGAWHGQNNGADSKLEPIMEIPEHAVEWGLTRQRESEHFVFYCVDQDVAALEDLEESLERCYDRVTSDLGRAPSGKTDVFIHPNLEQYHNAIGEPDAPDWAVGSSSWSSSLYMVSPMNPGPEHYYDDMIIIAVHEFVHAVVVGQINKYLPTYLDEGIACYEARQFDNMEYYIPQDIKNSNLPSLTELETYSGYGDATRFYTYGTAYIDFVVKTFGFDKVTPLLEGKTQEEVFGMSMEELNAKWMNFLVSYGK